MSLGLKRLPTRSYLTVKKPQAITQGGCEMSSS
jgi:hypothetical protein